MKTAEIITPTNTFPVTGETLRDIARKAMITAWILRAPVSVKLPGVKAVFCDVPPADPRIINQEQI